MKPFIKYPGGKMKEFCLVDRFKPSKITRYFEPFLGGGAIYLNMNVEDSYINDKSEDLINLFKLVQRQDGIFFEYLNELDRLWKEVNDKRMIKSSMFEIDAFETYVKKAQALKENKLQTLELEGYVIPASDRLDMLITARKAALYMCIRDLYNKKLLDKIKHTAMFYFIREYCYSAMFRFSKDGKFNVPYGGRSYNEKNLSLKIEQMRSNEIVKYLKNTSIYNLDFETFLDLFELVEDDFIFLDPPYDSEFSTYDQNQFDKSEQVRLSQYLAKTKAKWMLIIKKTDFIMELYKNFYVFEYDKNYMVSFKNRNSKDVKHLLITNYFIEV